MTPLTLDEYARSVIDDRLRDARTAALVAEARRDSRSDAHRSLSFAISARARLADGLRSLACRLDPCVVASEPRFLVSR